MPVQPRLYFIENVVVPTVSQTSRQEKRCWYYLDKAATFDESVMSVEIDELHSGIHSAHSGKSAMNAAK